MLSSIAFIILSITCFFVLDDFIVDLWCAFRKLKPKELLPRELAELRYRKEKRIAIMVANWHESDVIGRMVLGNIKRLEYSNYHFFLGVYPNDIETCVAAYNIAASFPKNVHVIENSKPGPTVKGQMLNEIVRGIFKKEKSLGIDFDVFLMHDSEDILHPLSLKLINLEIENTDFLQIPVFSFDRPAKQWVGSTYIDEFAEIHTKDLFVRQDMGAAVPSAGVGTALGRDLMLGLTKSPNGGFLREDSLTEDYLLGMSSAILGFKTSFTCRYVKRPDGSKDFIATREYFPNSFFAAIRQKTRWIAGIVIQGSKSIPWKGSWAHRYFLYRDRRGPMNNLVAMSTTVLSLYLIVSYFLIHRNPIFMEETWFKFESFVATLGMLSRLYHRLKAVYLVNGRKKLWAVILRWPIGNLINSWASVKALRDFYAAARKNQTLKWVKTKHELPEGFGNQELGTDGEHPNA